MTDDERRDVGKALRDSFLDPTDELEAALLHAFGYTRDDAEDFDLDYGAMLADLIDQTCRFEPAYEPDIMGKVSLVECSKCGWTIEPWNAVDFRYCPNCGAKVVMQDGD